ncbi:sedoheptulose 1-7-bisphosphatase-like [Venturia nashicola]|nr:sedoheptulose 1-7-bisphosphatase-like [Venturia nashicola]
MPPTPRVFLMRHGQTEWSQSGQYTGKTEIPLTEKGQEQVLATTQIVYGPGKLIDPAHLAKIFVSPRIRASQTFEILTDGEGPKEIVEELSEWSYGLYEGLLTKQIRKARKERGLDKEKEWDIWRDGCEEGESPQEVSSRLDTLIAKIRDIQAPHMDDGEPADVLLVAHGHILRAFVKRWLGYPLDFKLLLMLEPGGVGIVTYDHKSLDEPAVLVGLGFPLQEK